MVVSRAMHEDYAVPREAHNLACWFFADVAKETQRKAEAT
jgi:hypothetical protein